MTCRHLKKLKSLFSACLWFIQPSERRIFVTDTFKGFFLRLVSCLLPASLWMESFSYDKLAYTTTLKVSS